MMWRLKYFTVACVILICILPEMNGREQSIPGDAGAVGCLVDSCRECQYCSEGFEQYCEAGQGRHYNLFTPEALERWSRKESPGKKVGVVGLGALGHMGVKIAKAMGTEVIVFITSSSKGRRRETIEC